MKLKDANSKSHWNILVCCNQWKLMSDLKMSLGKMYNFASSSLFGFTSVIKLGNLDFEIHCVNIFDQENKLKKYIDLDMFCQSVSNLV